MERMIRQGVIYLGVAALAFATPALAQDGVFGNKVHFIRPCRILDTRIAVPGTTMVNGREWVVAAEGYSGHGAFRDKEVRRYLTMCGAVCYDDISRRPVPFHATGILVTVTAVGATGPGHLMLYDSTVDDPLSDNFRGTPLFSTVNFQKDAAVANTTVVELGQDQGYQVGDPINPDLAIRAVVAGGGTVHVVVDILAFLTPD